MYIILNSKAPFTRSNLLWQISCVKCILDLHVSHVGGEVQKNILSILLLAPASVGEQYCLVSPERLVASEEF